MAGGSGQRLWPLSRRNRPKQVLRLFGERSLLRMSFERLRALLPADHIFVIALQEHRDAFLADLPELPTGNFIGEPVGRDTAAAVGLSAAVLARRDPQAVVGVFTADHVIEPVERFAGVVQRGLRLAAENPGALVTFGIRPTSPHTGYGYVHRGEAFADGVYRVRRFTEKPDRATAEGFLAGGEHFWNSGMFAWRAESVLRELQRELPQTHDAARAIAADPSCAAAQYEKLRKISIDFAVMEKARDVLVVEMDVRWLDVGSWPALRDVLPADAAGNVFAAANAAVIDAGRCIMVSESGHLLAAIGVEDLVIVHSPDATLVCRRDQAERIKSLLEQLGGRFGQRYA